MRASVNAIRDIPEIAALGAASGTVRIAPEVDVPLTDRVRRLIDTAPFRRLARVSQLGLVALVYPGARHSRFEHSLGVFRTALQFLAQLAPQERFRATVDVHGAELFIATALLHDLGHWPYCHPIEDLALEGVPHHEEFCRAYLLGTEIGELLERDWGIAPEEVLALLAGDGDDPRSRLLASMLSGPIDVDKLDYLTRDSLHAGVPYGRHFDRERLIKSLCLDRSGDGLALTEKGKTAAELLIFARYVMFSEVYWHHGVRAATAMLQRAFFSLYERIDLEALLRAGDDGMESELRRGARGEAFAPLVEGLFGARRALYKRLVQFSYFQERDVYERVARRPYPWLVRCATEFAQLASAATGTDVAPHEIIFDAPPVEKEVEFDIDVHFPKEGVYRRLEEVSPVARSLAREQFDDYVKRVRVFVHPRVAPQLRSAGDLPGLVVEAAAAADAG